MSAEDLAGILGMNVLDFEPYSPRYNIAPSQRVPVVRNNAAGVKEVAQLRWGLIPKWAKPNTPQATSVLINARSETAGEKPAFREAVQTRRCLVPADGFIEWSTAGKTKQPHWFRQSNERVIVFAGIWEPAGRANKHPEDTFAILTTAANDDLEPFHDRMPIILPRERFTDWLDWTKSWEEVQPLMRPWPANSIVQQPVNPRLNSPMEERAEWLERYSTGLFD